MVKIIGRRRKPTLLSKLRPKFLSDKKTYSRKYKKTDERKKKIKLRRNFLPTLLIITVLWACCFFIIYFFDPATDGIVPIFIIIVFLSLLFTLSTIFANTRRGLISSIAVSAFLILRVFGIGNILNLILLSALAITSDIYFSRQ